MVFVEPVPLQVGQRVRLGAVAGERLGFAPHLYDFLAIGAGRYLGPGVSSFAAAAHRVAAFSEERGWPAVIGEFGALNGVRRAVTMLDDECALFDRLWLSWTAWMYDPVGPDWNDEGASLVDVGGAERPWLDPLVRPYPRAIAGRPIASRFDRVARTYELCFEPGGGAAPGAIAANATSEVFVPRARRWAERFDVQVSGADHDWNERESTLRLTASPGAREVRLVVQG